jgi:hypothetical protein
LREENNEKHFEDGAEALNVEHDEGQDKTPDDASTFFEHQEHTDPNAYEANNVANAGRDVSQIGLEFENTNNSDTAEYS